jgi:dTDP-4-dehydrorhamnose reductase
MLARSSAQIQLWGGVECTVARLGDRWRDQLAETGHRQRPEDLDRIAELGIRTLRYPVLWETVSPLRPDVFDWSWADERLSRLRRLGVTPIAGLVHHGSGPAYTNLLDPEFPRLLANYASAVAARYPWIEHFTPVNEPLTTARFSGLYGHWYPHCRDMASFLRALVNQCRGVVLSMRAIRSVTPNARLVQTEDLGKTFGTQAVSAQVEDDNERRWLTFDILTGRIDRRHPWWGRMVAAGVSERELDGFVSRPCPPDVVGINHYLTSERYLDERLARYPQSAQGGNGVMRYADVEAVRVNLPSRVLGPQARLREAWDRYGLPLAVTEAHHGCSRDEQLRWLAEVWTAAQAVQVQGCDIRAVTAWALLGSIDWNTLLTATRGDYEPGAFDIRGPRPRATALAGAVRQLARGKPLKHPVLETPGWWHRPERLYGPVAIAGEAAPHGPPLLVTGAGGLVAEFRQIGFHRGLPTVEPGGPGRARPSAAALRTALARHRPWAVVSLPPAPGVDGGEAATTAAFAPWAAACAEADIPMLLFTSDRVFARRRADGSVESDAVCPDSRRGAAEAAAEHALLSMCRRGLVVRTSALFGAREQADPAVRTLCDLRAGAVVEADDALVLSPTYAPDLIHAALDLLIDGETGIWHLTNGGLVTACGVARQIARHAGFDPAAIRARKGVAGCAGLASERGRLLPRLENALERFVRVCTLDPISPWERSSEHSTAG